MCFLIQSLHAPLCSPVVYDHDDGIGGKIMMMVLELALKLKLKLCQPVYEGKPVLGEGRLSCEGEGRYPPATTVSFKSLTFPERICL